MLLIVVILNLSLDYVFIILYMFKDNSTAPLLTFILPNFMQLIIYWSLVFWVQIFSQEVLSPSNYQISLLNRIRSFVNCFSDIIPTLMTGATHYTKSCFFLKFNILITRFYSIGCMFCLKDPKAHYKSRAYVRITLS